MTGITNQNKNSAILAIEHASMERMLNILGLMHKHTLVLWLLMLHLTLDNKYFPLLCLIGISSFPINSSHYIPAACSLLYIQHPGGLWASASAGLEVLLSPALLSSPFTAFHFISGFERPICSRVTPKCVHKHEMSTLSTGAHLHPALCPRGIIVIYEASPSV